MKPRMRLVGWNIRIVRLTDGAPVNVEPGLVAAADWDEFKSSIAFQIEPAVMVDDGELAPFRVAPLLIPASNWEAFAAGDDAAAVAQIRFHIEGPPPAPKTSRPPRTARPRARTPRKAVK